MTSRTKNVQVEIWDDQTNSWQHAPDEHINIDGRWTGQLIQKTKSGTIKTYSAPLENQINVPPTYLARLRTIFQS